MNVTSSNVAINGSRASEASSREDGGPWRFGSGSDLQSSLPSACKMPCAAVLRVTHLVPVPIQALLLPGSPQLAAAGPYPAISVFAICLTSILPICQPGFCTFSPGIAG